jgi:hypothetical protein
MAGVFFLNYWLTAAKPILVCTHVLQGASPTLIAHHRDGDIQVLCDRPQHRKEECGFVDLGQLVFFVPELTTTPEVRPGEWALREGHEAWRVDVNPEDV